MIEANFGGVRVDGTNATIIGAGDGNFIADRNGIARVWMDHALWPQMTTQLYLDQTGDLALLDRKAPYFKDPQAMRGNGIDEAWAPEQGSWQRTEAGRSTAAPCWNICCCSSSPPSTMWANTTSTACGGRLERRSGYGRRPGEESVAFTCAYARQSADASGPALPAGRAQPRRQSGADGGTDGAAAPRPGLRRPGRQAGHCWGSTWSAAATP